MNYQILSLAFIMAFSVTSAFLYLLSIIYYAKDKTSESKKDFDGFLKQIMGIFSIITAVLSLFYFFTTLPIK